MQTKYGFSETVYCLLIEFLECFIKKTLLKTTHLTQLLHERVCVCVLVCARVCRCSCTCVQLAGKMSRSKTQRCHRNAICIWKHYIHLDKDILTLYLLFIIQIFVKISTKDLKLSSALLIDHVGIEQTRSMDMFRLSKADRVKVRDDNNGTC